jgi:hypothetical protein
VRTEREKKSRKCLRKHPHERDLAVGYHVRDHGMGLLGKAFGMEPFDPLLVEDSVAYPRCD